MAKNPRSRKTQISGKARLAGLGVHAFTASGAVLGFLALLAALDGRFTEMFAWLVAALVVDTVDGSFARRVDIKRTAPEFSGEVLDLVVDFITYVLVPTYALYAARLLPDPVALPAVALILVTAALYFADTRMKTGDWYFRGFPGVWNLYAFLVFVLRPDPWIAFAGVVLFSALTFAPFKTVHPMRVQYLRSLNLALLLATAVLCILALWWDLAPPLWVKIGIGASALHFLLIGFFAPKTAR
jgi:phosphatidylcholine synthase